MSLKNGSFDSDDTAILAIIHFIYCDQESLEVVNTEMAFTEGIQRFSRA